MYMKKKRRFTDTAQGGGGGGTIPSLLQHLVAQEFLEEDQRARGLRQGDLYGGRLRGGGYEAVRVRVRS
jgi:hypothetical protein